MPSVWVSVRLWLSDFSSETDAWFLPRPTTAARLQQRAEVGEQAALRAGADDLRDDLAVPEHAQRWHREDPVALRGHPVLVHVHLGDGQRVAELRGDLVKDGREQVAGRAPLRPEVDQDRLAERGGQDQILERVVGDLDDRAGRFRVTHCSSSRISLSGPRFSSSQRGTGASPRSARRSESRSRTSRNSAMCRSRYASLRRYTSTDAGQSSPVSCPASRHSTNGRTSASENPIACSDLISLTSRTWWSS